MIGAAQALRSWSSALAGCSLVLCGCSTEAEKRQAEEAVTRFHAMFDAGRLREIYAGSGAELKRTASEAEFIRVAGTVRQRLGTVRNTMQQGWNVNFGTGGTVVTVVYDTHFLYGTGIEQFVFRTSGQQAVLIGYHINSRDLIGPPAGGTGR
jgi:hypothetical protein